MLRQDGDYLRRQRVMHGQQVEEWEAEKHSLHVQLQEAQHVQVRNSFSL